MPTPDIHSEIDRLNAEAWELRNVDTARSLELAASAERMSRAEDRYIPGLARSIYTAGMCAIVLGEYAVARQRLSEAHDIVTETSEPVLENDILIGLGTAHLFSSDFSRALELYRVSLTKCRELGDRHSEARVLGNIGTVHFDMGDYPKAMEHHRQSLAICQEDGYLATESNELCNIGNVHASLGEYAQAVEHYQAARRVNQQTGNQKLEASVLGNIGSILSRLGEYSKALEYHDACHSLNREIGNRYGEATALGEIASVWMQLEDSGRARQYSVASLEICREIGNRWGEVMALIGCAAAAGSHDERRAALRDLDAAAAIADEIGARSLRVNALLNRGEILALLGDTDSAIESVEIARAEAMELGERDMELQACDLLSEQFERKGDVRMALEHLRRNMQLQNEITGDETRRKVHALESSWQIELARREAEIERLRNVELKQALDDLKSAQTQLVQSERMASLGQLTAGIAHEINNPINFVSASVSPIRRNITHLHNVLESLLDELPPERKRAITAEEEIAETIEELEQLVRSVEDGAGRTARIVAGLRSFSRLDESGLKRVDLHEGLDAAVAILSGSLSRGVELIRDYGELPAVECHPGEINQVFMNILTNAIKAITGTGTISIRTEVVDDDVRISIADSGVGMTPEIRSRIFEPFFTTRDVGEGRGLGLSIAWGIVEKHGGAIDVESVPGGGSTFVLTLPVG